MTGCGWPTSLSLVRRNRAVDKWGARLAMVEHMREVISTPDAPHSPLCSQGIKAGGHISVSGLVGVDVTTGQVAGPTIQQQTRQALANCEAVLKAAGASLADVVEVGILLADPDDFAGMNEEWTVCSPVVEIADNPTHVERPPRPRSPGCGIPGYPIPAEVMLKRALTEATA